MKLRDIVTSERQREVFKISRGDRLTSLIEEKGYTVMSLSKVAGVPYTTIRSMIERDLSNASIDNTLKICKVLGVQIEDILVNRSEMVAEKQAEYRITQDDDWRYPYYDVSVAAGIPSTVNGITEGSENEITIPDIMMGKYAGSEDIFLMRVNGDSMNKVIPHESMIAVKKINLDALSNNDIVVFSNCHQYSVKRFYNDTESKRLIFSSESMDRRFTDHIVPYEEADDLIIHGKVVLYIVTT